MKVHGLEGLSRAFAEARSNDIKRLCKGMVKGSTSGRPRVVHATSATARNPSNNFLTGYAVEIDGDESIIDFLDGHLEDIGMCNTIFPLQVETEEQAAALSKVVSNPEILTDITSDGYVLEAYASALKNLREANAAQYHVQVRVAMATVSSSGFGVAHVSGVNYSTGVREHALVFRSTGLVGVAKAWARLNASGSPVTAAAFFTLMDDVLSATRGAQSYLCALLLAKIGMANAIAPTMLGPATFDPWMDFGHPNKPKYSSSTPLVYMEELVPRGSASVGRYMLYLNCTSLASPQAEGALVHWSTHMGSCFVASDVRCTGSVFMGAKRPVQQSDRARIPVHADVVNHTLYTTYNGYWKHASNHPAKYAKLLMKRAADVNQADFFGTAVSFKSFDTKRMLAASLQSTEFKPISPLQACEIHACYAGSVGVANRGPSSVLASMIEQDIAEGKSVEKQADSDSSRELGWIPNGVNTPFIIHGSWDDFTLGWFTKSAHVFLVTREYLLRDDACERKQQLLASAHKTILRGAFNTGSVIHLLNKITENFADGIPSPVKGMDGTAAAFDAQAGTGKVVVSWHAILYALAPTWFSKWHPSSSISTYHGERIYDDFAAFVNGTGPMPRFFIGEALATGPHLTPLKWYV